MSEELTEREQLLLGALRSTIGALRAIDSANGALSEGAGSVLYDNPDRLAQSMNQATSAGQGSYIQASLLLERLGLKDRVTPFQGELHAIGFNETELAAMLNQAGSRISHTAHLIEQAQMARNPERVKELYRNQQMWLGINSRLHAAVLALQPEKSRPTDGAA